MLFRQIFILLLATAALSPLSLNAQDCLSNWTHFRGTHLDGISKEKGFPVIWSDSVNIRWKTPVSGKGWSSPVIYGNQVWLTTEENREMSAICYDLQSGNMIHHLLVFNPDTLYRKHSINTYATPTPAIEEGFIYIHFGRYGTACLKTGSGEIVWKRTDMQVEHIQGPGSSLLIYKDILVVHLEGTDMQYIAALDKKTGETLWKTDRPKALYDLLDPIGKKAYVTPIIVTVNGRDLMISNGSAACIAYDPETGKEVWRIIQGEDSTISMPVESEGIVYFYTAFVTGDGGEKYAELFAVDPDGKGDIGDSNIRWRIKSPILQLQTPVVVNGLLYTVDSKGLLSCLEGTTGETVWSTKLKGKYYSSPVYADGAVYFSSTKGNTLVCKAGSELEILSENTLEGEIWATPALARGAIYMRTSKFLYKISLPSPN